METGTQKTNYTPENIALLIETNRKLSEKNSILIEETLHLKTKASELETNLENAEKRIDWLMEQFKLNKQRTFGNKVESSESLQLSLVFDETEESVEVIPYPFSG